MQFSAREIINILPPGEWQIGWKLQPSCWSSCQQSAHIGTFETLSAPGDLTQASDEVNWSFHITPPRHSIITRCLLLMNGFIIAGDSGSTPFATACFVVEPGVLLGMSTTSMIPQLFSHTTPVKTTDTEHYLETAHGHVLCCFDASLYGTTFCLINNDLDYTTQAKKAQAYLKSDFNTRITRELNLRGRYMQMESSNISHTHRARQSIEFLARALQPPNENLPFRWSNCGEDALRLFDINMLFPLVETWKHIDQSVAGELVQSALATQMPSGMVPAWIEESGARANIPCLPFLARAAASVYELTHDPDFLVYVKPRLLNYLNWAFEYYDNMHDGHFAWVSAEESFIPETFYPHVTAVDLISFLICETESLLTMCLTLGHDTPEIDTLKKKKLELTVCLLQSSWDAGSRQFKGKQVNGTFIDRLTLASATPLLWSDIPEPQKSSVLLLMSNTSPLMSDNGLAGWETWESDRYSVTIQPLHQFVMLTALQQQEQQPGQKPFVERLSTHLFEQPEGSTDLTHQLIHECLRIQLWFREYSQANAENTHSKCINFMDRHALAITMAALLVIALGVSISAIATLSRKTMTIPTIESYSGLAQLYYNQGQYDKAIDYYLKLSQGVGSNTHIETQLANAYFKIGEYEAAESHYRNALDQGDPSPKPLINLALTLHRQGRSLEAIKCYVRAAKQFREYPNLRNRVVDSVNLIKEHRFYHLTAPKQSVYENGS